MLTEEGKEAFSRHYSWFARLLIEEIAKEYGAAGLRTRLGRIASAVVAQLHQHAYSADAGQVFRVMAATCSGACRPGESG